VPRGSAPLEIDGKAVPPGETRRIEIPVARLATQTPVHLSVVAVNGRHPGPRLWLSAAVHGDEINGVEIIRRVLAAVDPARLRGAVVAVPVVNIFGFLNQSRYLPDRRDLNRSFPGSPQGSLASRLARLFLDRVVAQCTHGIDLHTAAAPRANLPQIRADLDDPATRACARAFGAPVILHARTRDGSLRAAAADRGLTTLLFEGGEPLRFNEDVIRAGREGILRVMSHLGMLAAQVPARRMPVLESRASTWVRAGQSGLFHRETELGNRVRAREPIGRITDVPGDLDIPVLASREGVVIGVTMVPLVSRGDALVHIAEPASEGQRPKARPERSR